MEHPEIPNFPLEFFSGYASVAQSDICCSYSWVLAHKRLLAT